MGTEKRTGEPIITELEKQQSPAAAKNTQYQSGGHVKPAPVRNANTGAARVHSLESNTQERRKTAGDKIRGKLNQRQRKARGEAFLELGTTRDRIF